MDPSQKMWSKLLGFVLFVANIHTTVSDGVLGCGGFVKSDVEINFSLVEMKLYTVQGSIKYQTDCAPNNGYYLIPLYDKGDFVLQVEPPPGWSFEPELVRLHIDGTTDKCSLGEDINFQFKGFSIQGMVLSKGQKKGPGGVHLSLMAVGSDEVLQTTTSVENQNYNFKKVMPGDYIIKAHHDTWKFERPTATVTVTLDNGIVTNDIVVAGYDVSGRVFSEGEPIKGVHFLLYSDTVKPQDVTLCDTSPVKGLKTVDASICHVSSQEDGVFTFPSLSPGEYHLVPFYKGEHITFDVVPEKITFHVEHNSIHLSKEFQVAGFSVSGLVVDSVKGHGIAGAQIFVGGKQMAISDSDGSYHLENMKTGKYNIQVVSDKIFFEEVSLKITPNTPQLPDIVASRFSVCGKVNIDEIPKGLDRTALQRKVNVFTEGYTVKVMNLDTDMQGEFCAAFKPGKYVFQVVLSPQELKAGLYLSPEAQLVTITNKPVLDVTFSQFRAKVSGFITCIENCGALGLSLDPIGMIGEDKKVIMLKDSLKKASFEFENILPGKYKVTPLQDNWCWKEKSKEIEITDKDVMGLEFTQTGYILKCGLSHEITLNFAHENKQGSVGSFALKKGTNRFCLSQPGVYRLTTDSCHRFEKDVYTYDTSNPVVLSLTAVKHKVTGVINTEVPAENLLVSIKSPLMKSPITIEPSEEKKVVDSAKESKEDVDPAPVAKDLKYYFSYWAKSNERLEIKVLSEELLFSPNQVDVTVHGESCPGELAHFTGKVGIFITGKVEPSLSGVQVTVSSPDNAAMEPVTLETNENGVYRLGPLHSDKKYNVEAAKVGFVLTKDPNNPMNFKALKLGEIAVQVVDESDQSLSNVLLSLSGDRQYRSNNLTKNGAMVFSSLSPGQYFLRPMMKEYRFEPASQMITVLEGTTMSLKIKGFREAYSCYGHSYARYDGLADTNNFCTLSAGASEYADFTYAEGCYGRVSSLNGEPEPGVVVEAISVSGDVKYQEESKTEQDGTYRIRGLQPSVTYQIQLKKVENSHLERSAPKFRLLKVENSDLTNVNIIAFRRMNQMDVSGNVVTPPDILPTLKVVLYKEDSPDSPTHSISLGTTSFFYLPSLPTDDQEYNLRLESSLSYSKYDYILPEYSFVANTAYKHVTFKFDPKRLVDQDFNQSSFLSLPLALLVLGAAYTVYKYRNNYGKRRMVDQDLLSFLMLPFAMLVTGYKYISNIFRNNYGKIVPLNTRDVFSQPVSDSSNQSIAESLLPDTGSGKRKIKVRKT